MSVFKSKTILIIILTSYGIALQSPTAYIAALLIPLLPLDLPVLSLVLAVLALIPRMVAAEPFSFGVLVCVLVAYVVFHGMPWKGVRKPCVEGAVSSKYLIFVYFFCFSFLSLAHLKPAHYFALLALYIMLFIYSINAATNTHLRTLVMTFSYLTIAWGCSIELFKHVRLPLFDRVRSWGDEQWWFYLMISFSAWLGLVLAYQIEYEMTHQHSLQEGEMDERGVSHRTNFSKPGAEVQMIQMRVLTRKSAEFEKRQDSLDIDDDNLSQGESSHSSRRNILPPISPELSMKYDPNLVQKLLRDPEDMNLRKHRSQAKSAACTKFKQEEEKEQNKEKRSSEGRKKLPDLKPLKSRFKSDARENSRGAGFHSQYAHELQSQQEITNLFLLIPFTLFEPSFLQIPIYFYLIWLQNGRTPMWVFYLMFTSICVITFLETTGSMKIEILLRLCLILIVNKNFKWAINITRVLRSIWLRSSFVFVLLVLFWFSLLTVNVFHICFVLIVLLFITRNNTPDSLQPSFRHRNWKYLMLLFNVFLVLRLIWMISQRDIDLRVPNRLHDILSIVGLTYNYGLNWEYFNMIPLLVSGVLTVQYWTYSSRIYDLESKKTLQFLPAYRTFILKLLQILTIVYYKLIPWASHFLVIIIIISLQFSLIADLVLIWSLFILLVHMIKPNQLSAYRKMYRMWDIFLKLVSIQIVLRYFFEFIKFPLIYSHISQFPIIKTLIHYQELLGLAIRQSEIAYIKNVFTKFQLMMILDFAIIAISFLTIQYYDIMIKYHEATGRERSQAEESSQKVEREKEKEKDKQKEKEKEKEVRFDQNIEEQQKDESSVEQIMKKSHTVNTHDAVFIYQNYIDFKLTKWLENFNEFMLIFSKLFLKIYYPLLGTFSCLYYSYATMLYFLFCVYYYLKINLKYYELYALNQVQSRIMKLFHLWRLKNEIRVNLVQKEPIRTDHILLEKGESIQMRDLEHRDKEREGEKPSQAHLDYVIEQPIPEQIKASTKDPVSLYRQLKKQITVTNFNILFHNFITLHTKLRFWLLLLTLTCIALNYTSRLLTSTQIHNFLTPENIEYWRYVLYICGTSVQSPININVYLLIVGFTVLEIKCCSLAVKIGYVKEREKSQGKSSSEEEKEEELMSMNTQRRKKERINIVETKEVQKFIDVSISLRLGLNKITQRFFVILLVFVSLLQNQNPFSIIYLICAWFLNYMGQKSIQGLSLTLAFLLILQYSLIITDTTNRYIGVSQLFPSHIHHSWIIELFRIADPQWITYLTFADRMSQAFVMYLSLVILMLYQLCFYLQEHNWVQILDKMFQRISIGGIYLKLYEKISQIYEYALVYSPLFIITLCLGLYLMDFTATNMFLSILSIIFLFKSFLLQNYTNSRPFWKSYFRILQLLIVIFMVVYCVLSAPMYNQYCNKVLCSPEEFRTKITKTILLLILQIGIDLISSHHFINAMATLENTLNETSSFYRIAISIVQNDKKIQKSFQSIKRKETIKKSIKEVTEFLNMYENDQTVRFDNRKQIQSGNQSWLDAILNFMPSFIDASLIKGPEETRLFVKEENKQFIQWLEKKNGAKLSEEELKNINEIYVNEFADCQTEAQLKKKLDHMLWKSNQMMQVPSSMAESNRSVHVMHRQKKNSFNQLSADDLMSQGANIRKSYIQGIMPYDDELEASVNIAKRPTNRSIRQEQELENRETLKRSSRKTLAEQLSDANQEQKKKILYLKIFQSVVSNWHYLTYTLMILEFIINMGVLTLPFPILTFTLGIVHSYQAPKNVWRLAFLALLPPIFFKYSLQIELIKPGHILQFIMIGSNNTSILIEYLLMFFIVVQCLILKIAGLYDQSTAEVECMNIALIRNIINVDQNNETKQQQRKAFYTLLERSKQPSSTFFEYLFSLYQCKFGYDYSTLMITIQLTILVYIFSFYDRMAIRQQLTFYKMIEYNQFTTGMVIMAFIQLGFILLDRIMTVLELTYRKWDLTLILKYGVMGVSLVYVHVMVLAFFPINSGYYGTNHYIVVFYILHIFYFLISALQIKVGLNKESRGFLDRYTWYNGYIYMFYRAIPFLFEFKVFSDWTFTTTSLRLFDWIKYEEILGYVYVAKCNSLFLRGKILGSKIQWWKKLLMGFPLLLTIILLLFGPLILFSSLNPLASLNEVTGGYLELSLKINKTNEYPFYINTHITDIHFLDKEPDKELEQLIKTFELDERSIQIIHLEPFSDQYWEISQGSYNKLIDEPETSLYQLTMRVKFDRNQTKTTPVYILNTYTIPLQRVHEFKETLQGRATFVVHNFVPSFMRLDNNNGLHFLTQQNFDIKFHAEESRTLRKKYWVINEGITFKLASDKYSKAIFGYSVMSFYISIILVVANYFRFLFQGSAYTIIMSDIPYADPILSICDGIYQARLRGDIYEEEMLFWTLIDIIRSPDLMKAITGNYLNARIETLQLAGNAQAEEVANASPERKGLRRSDRGLTGKKSN